MLHRTRAITSEDVQVSRKQDGGFGLRSWSSSLTMGHPALLSFLL